MILLEMMYSSGGIKLIENEAKEFLLFTHFVVTVQTSNDMYSYKFDIHTWGIYYYVYWKFPPKII
jgi:hypothetical protein